MKTDSIQMILSAKYGPQESYTDEQLNTISSLSINRFDVVGDFLKIYPEELLRFPNLKRLSLDQCVIGEDFIEILVQLKNLEVLSLYNCEFMNSAEKVFQLPYLKKITLDGTEIPISYLDNSMLTTLILANITISDDVSFYVDELDIRNADILNWNFLKSKIGKLIVTATQYQNSPELQKYKKPIEIMDDIDPETVMEEVNLS